MLILSKELDEMIRMEGEKSYSNECCGILIGTIGDGCEKKVKHIEPIHNAGEDGERYHRFLITPQDMLRAEFAAKNLAMKIIGFYHSHPDHPASPSDYDKDHALPIYSYVIVSVIRGEAKELTSWELTNDKSGFLQEKISTMNITNDTNLMSGKTFNSSISLKIKKDIECFTEIYRSNGS